MWHQDSGSGLIDACGNWDVATIVDIRLLENITEENKKDVIDLLKYRFMKSCLVATDMWQLICGSIGVGKLTFGT